ncbi:unnamed protein product, partial [Brenthis ino]
MVGRIAHSNHILNYITPKTYIKNAQQEIGESRRADVELTDSKEKKEKFVRKMIENFESKGLSKAEILKLLQELLASTRHEDLKMASFNEIPQRSGSGQHQTEGH